MRLRIFIFVTLAKNLSELAEIGRTLSNLATKFNIEPRPTLVNISSPQAGCITNFLLSGKMIQNLKKWSFWPSNFVLAKCDISSYIIWPLNILISNLFKVLAQQEGVRIIGGGKMFIAVFESPWTRLKIKKEKCSVPLMPIKTNDCFSLVYFFFALEIFCLSIIQVFLLPDLFERPVKINLSLPWPICTNPTVKMLDTFNDPRR